MGIDSEKIGIIGYSQGGLVAALTAAQRNDIYKLCLIYPAFSIMDQWGGRYESIDEMPDEINIMGMTVGRRYYVDLMKLEIDDVYAYAAQYQGPVLLQHGTADEAVPYRVSQTAFQYYQNCNLITLDGAGHGFVGEDDIYSVQQSYAFFIGKNNEE